MYAFALNESNFHNEAEKFALKVIFLANIRLKYIFETFTNGSINTTYSILPRP